MKSGALIHPGLLEMLAGLGHADRVLVCDAGFPVPPSVRRIDLGFRPGRPAFLDVLEVVVATIHIERADIATEASLALGSAIDGTLGLRAQRIAHDDLKALARECRGAIRTGEYTPYANVILAAGVAFS